MLIYKENLEKNMLSIHMVGLVAEAKDLLGNGRILMVDGGETFVCAKMNRF